METRHPQVPVLWFTCDEDLADLITLMNHCGIETLLSWGTTTAAAAQKPLMTKYCL
jgi:hypothetical protein